MGTMESVVHSINSGINFTDSSSSSPNVYKFVTECPEDLSNSGDNSNHFNSDNELDSQLGNNNHIQMINIAEINNNTSFTDIIHPPGSKRRLYTDNVNVTTTTTTNDQQSFTDERYSSEKLTKGKQKIPIEFIVDRTKRYSTFSKRKTGLMKKAVELAELTGAEVLLLVASETNHVYTFATQRLKGIIELECGKRLIQTCLSSSSSINSNNNVSMKIDQSEVNNNNVKTNHQNVNHSRKSCKKEDSTVAVNTDTFNNQNSINDLKNISDDESKVDTTLLHNDSVPKSLFNSNHIDELKQCFNTVPSTIIDSSHNVHSVASLSNETFCNNISQTTNVSNSTEYKNMVYVPVSVFPSPSQNVLTLTPLSSNLLLTAQMTANQLLLVPQLNSVPYVTTTSANVLNSCSLSTPTSNSYSPYSMGFLNVNTGKNESSEISANYVTKESNHFTPQNCINERITNGFINNSCKYYFKPPD
ncbi:unnamed protein product [Schistosoma turkestanicum]|nr:unnamed protein product [Schistosoma turkestanicum]